VFGRGGDGILDQILVMGFRKEKREGNAAARGKIERKRGGEEDARLVDYRDSEMKDHARRGGGREVKNQVQSSQIHLTHAKR